MTGAQSGAALAAVIVAVLGLLLSRKDAKNEADKNVQMVPDNPSAVARFRQRMRDKQAKNNIQP